MSSYHHGNLREALVGTAVALGREGGPARIGIREVARRVNVSHNAAYRHFADRDDLLLEVARVGIEELSGRMHRVTRRARAVSPEDRARRRLRATGQAYVEFALDEPGLFTVTFSKVTMDELVAPFQYLNDALDECVEAGFMLAEKRAGAELSLWASVHGFSVLYSTGPLREVPPRERDAALSRLLDRIEESLTA